MAQRRFTISDLRRQIDSMNRDELFLIAPRLELNITDHQIGTRRLRSLINEALDAVYDETDIVPSWLTGEVESAEESDDAPSASASEGEPTDDETLPFPDPEGPATTADPRLPSAPLLGERYIDELIADAAVAAPPANAEAGIAADPVVAAAIDSSVDDTPLDVDGTGSRSDMVAAVVDPIADPTPLDEDLVQQEIANLHTRLDTQAGWIKGLDATTTSVVAKLRKDLDEVRAADEATRAVNDQVRKSNEGLAAINRDLRADNEALRTANEQIVADITPRVEAIEERIRELNNLHDELRGALQSLPTLDDMVAAVLAQIDYNAIAQQVPIDYNHIIDRVIEAMEATGEAASARPSGPEWPRLGLEDRQIDALRTALPTEPARASEPTEFTVRDNGHEYQIRSRNNGDTFELYWPQVGWDQLLPQHRLYDLVVSEYQRRFGQVPRVRLLEPTRPEPRTVHTLPDGIYYESRPGIFLVYDPSRQGWRDAYDTEEGRIKADTWGYPYDGLSNEQKAQVDPPPGYRQAERRPAARTRSNEDPPEFLRSLRSREDNARNQPLGDEFPFYLTTEDGRIAVFDQNKADFATPEQLERIKDGLGTDLLELSLNTLRNISRRLRYEGDNLVKEVLKEREERGWVLSDDEKTILRPQSEQSASPSWTERLGFRKRGTSAPQDTGAEQAKLPFGIRRRSGG